MTFAEPYSTILSDALAEVAKHALAAQSADDPAAIRKALASMWSAGHVAYQATLDGEDATRKAALSKLETARAFA
jgi:hypothetical protein